MITKIKDFSDLIEQAKKYEDLDYLPVSKQVYEKYVGFLSPIKELLNEEEFKKLLDNDWYHQGKLLKVID